MLKLEGLGARVGSFVLRPLDLELAQGQFHALLGPSGAGKSTLLEVVVGFRRPEAGRICLEGRDLAGLAVEDRGIGYLPQRLALFPHMTVRENVLYGIRCRRRPHRDDLDRTERLLGSLGLARLQERRPDDLSGGERQRTALARALAPAPRLLILDEPFSALNETLRRELWSVVKDLQREFHLTALLVTHDLEEAFELGEAVHVLVDGCLQQSGPRRQVFDRPVTLAVARLVGFENFFPARIVNEREGNWVLELTTLGRTLAVPRQQLRAPALNRGDCVTGCMRSARIELLWGETGSGGDELRLTGTAVEVTERIDGAVLLFRPDGSTGLLRVAVGSREFGSLRQSRLEVRLPLDHLVWLPGDFRLS